MKRHTKWAWHREAGFSFIELLVTIVIASIAFAAMVPLFVQAQQASSADKMRAVALNLAQDRIEKLRQVGFELITRANLASDAFYFGEFGSTWKEQTETGQRDFTVAYSVTDKQVSTTDTRVAYKVVTVTVDWVGPPNPHKTAVLTTMIYRQDSGPELADFLILTSDLGPTDTTKSNSETGIVRSPVHMQATINAADLDSMKSTDVGVPPHAVVGRVDFLVTSSTGAASPTISVPYVPYPTKPEPAVFSAEWPVPAPLDTPGAADGLYTFKAVAFTAMGSPGNSWELTYRVERGAPASVANLQGTASLTSASLTWDASTTGDVDHYVVRRTGMVDVVVPKKSGSMGFQETFAAPVPKGTAYSYSVYAVDWKGLESVAAVKNLVAGDTGLAPNPATNLGGEVFGDVVRLTWTAPTTPPAVLGYRVYQTIGGITKPFTTASATLDVTQGWGISALYQVKPYGVGDVEALAWATLLVGQTNVGGWLSMVTSAQLLYTLNIQNTTKDTLSTLRLYYLGAAGADPEKEMLPAKLNVAPNATASWTNLAAGKYRWDWPGPGNSGTKSRTGWCTGAVLTIPETTK
jgi:prepilin-type N-terminal cleavage/methylation domain-containing protein